MPVTMHSQLGASLLCTADISRVQAPCAGDCVSAMWDVACLLLAMLRERLQHNALLITAAGNSYAYLH